MASATGSTMNKAVSPDDDDGLTLSWSGRWTLAHRILAAADQHGEPYVLSDNGAISRLVPAP